MTLSLVITDLFLDPLQADATRGRGMPRLPMLGRLLDWAVSRRVGRGWRGGLMQDLGIAGAELVAPSSVAAHALPAATGGPDVCFVQPVHRVAGISRVHLHPAGLLKLTDPEARQLCASFNSELGQQRLQLQRVGDGLLLVGTMGPGIDDESQDPGRFPGRELAAAHMQTSPLLSRLGAEAEMWLHRHPLNQAREARGELPVNALWFWGPGPRHSPRTLQRIAQQPLARAFGADPFVVGCWQALGAAADPGVDRFNQLPQSSGCVVVSAAQQFREVPRLQQLEADWFDPLVTALDAGLVESISLRIGGDRWDIRRPGLSRWWRRTVPWWQRVTA